MHEILIDYTPPIGVWKRYGTVDHPNKKNGAVKFMGDYAHVQNHATMIEPVTWFIDKNEKIDYEKIKKDIKKAEIDRQEMQLKAKLKANFILKCCKNDTHQYLINKGFKDEQGLIYTVNDEKLLVIPMRISNELCGVQLINEQGEKKFLFGAKTAGATYKIGNGEYHFICEGYATGLSLKRALNAFKIKYTIHVCFSAGNALNASKTIFKPIFIADNDKSGTGERVARESCAKWWMPPEIGFDANDYEVLHGTFSLGLQLKKLIIQKN
jgi:putative DNA primase/helicase